MCEDVIVKGENALQTSVTFQLKQAHSNLFKVWRERERERDHLYGYFIEFPVVIISVFMS